LVVDLLEELQEKSGIQILDNIIFQDGYLNEGWPDLFAVFLLPNVQQCLYVCETAAAGGITMSIPLQRAKPRNLARMKYLALSPSGPEPSYHIFEARGLLSRLPNLEVLIAPDCGAETDRSAKQDHEDKQWDVPLKHLRKLSISGLHPTVLTKILSHCPVLEDLECYLGLDQQYPILRLEHLHTQQQTLRRLCYSVAMQYVQTPEFRNRDEDQGEDDDDDSIYKSDMAERMSGTLTWVPTPRDPFDASVFPRLEILEIEQVLLCGTAFIPERKKDWYRMEQLDVITAETFMARLPPRVRVLHIGMVVCWPAMHRDLIELASLAVTRFPHLQIVRVDAYDEPPRDEVQQVTSLMSETGITFLVGQTPESSSSRGMLGPRPGHPEVVDVPAVMFPLVI
jgi:hypothetical protein